MTGNTERPAKLSLLYTLRASGGDVIDQTEADSPLELTLGDGTIHPSLENCLRDLPAGARAQFRLSAEDAFGPYDPEKVQTLERSSFADQAMLESGAMILFETPNGDEVPGRVVAVEQQQVRIDFNHPLAGQDIEFDVHILNRD